MINRLQTGPSLLLWAPKSLKNGPKWPKMAPKGPQESGMVIPCPTIPDLGPFRLAGPKKVSVSLGQNEIHYKANHSKLLNLQMAITPSILGLFESFKKLKSSTSQCLCSHI